MKAKLRAIPTDAGTAAKKLIKQYPEIDVAALTDLIKDQCIRERCEYSHDLATWAADREVYRENYSKIRQEQKGGKGWG